MNKQINKMIRRVKKSYNHFLNRLLFMIKLMIALIAFFFIVLFFMIKPYQSNRPFSFSQLDESISLSAEEKQLAFIETIAPYAKEAQKEYGVRPSVLVAQAALESNWGESTLSKESNNYFGIKSGSKGQEYATSEFNQEEWIEIKASFREYGSMRESVLDYANLLKQGTSWNASLYEEVVEANHYEDAAMALQKAGYATDPNYGDKIIQIIEQYHLYELDV